MSLVGTCLWCYSNLWALLSSVLPVSITVPACITKIFEERREKNQWLLLGYTSVTFLLICTSSSMRPWKQLKVAVWVEGNLKGLWISNQQKEQGDCLSGSGHQEAVQLKESREDGSPGAEPPEAWALCALSQRQKWRSESVPICQSLQKTSERQSLASCRRLIAETESWMFLNGPLMRLGVSWRQLQPAVCFRLLVGLCGAWASFLPNLHSLPRWSHWPRGFPSHLHPSWWPLDITAGHSGTHLLYCVSQTLLIPA